MNNKWFEVIRLRIKHILLSLECFTVKDVRKEWGGLIQMRPISINYYNSQSPLC